MSETPNPSQKPEEEENQFKIFDYIVEMEDRVDQIITHTQEKAQQEYTEKEKQLDADFEQKVKALTLQLEERKKVVLEKINGDKTLHDQLIADKVQNILTKFAQDKDTICDLILQQLHLPFVKTTSLPKPPTRKVAKRTKK